jgi:hypothetical protein
MIYHCLLLLFPLLVNSADTTSGLLSEIATFNNVSASYYDHIQSAAQDTQYRDGLLYKLHLIRTELIHVSNAHHSQMIVEPIKDYILTPIDLQMIQEGRIKIDKNCKAYIPNGQLTTFTVIAIGAHNSCPKCSFSCY